MMNNAVLEEGVGAVDGSVQQETEEQMRLRIEEEMKDECEKYVTTRVANAQKKWLKKQQKYEEQKKKEKEAQKKAQEDKEVEMILRERELRLDVVDLVSEYGMSGDFRNLIPYKDLLSIEDPVLRYHKLKERVLDLKEEFSKVVKKAVQEERIKFTAKA